MKAKNARLLLDLLGQFSLSELRSANAVEAVMELNEIARHQQTNYVYLIVYRNGGCYSAVSAVKALRVIFSIGLKEAKTMYDNAIDAAIVINQGAAIRIGPFSYGQDATHMIERFKEARLSGSLVNVDIELVHEDGIL